MPRARAVTSCLFRPRVYRGGTPFERLRMRNVLLNREGFRCIYCGDRLGFASMTFDHVRPRSHGGQFMAANLVAACAPCNNARGDMPADVFLFHMIVWAWPGDVKCG